MLDIIPKLGDFILHFEVKNIFIFTVVYLFELQINDGSINSHVTDSRLLSMDPVLSGSANFILQAAVVISILKCGDQDFYSHFKEKQLKRERKKNCVPVRICNLNKLLFSQFL